MVDAVVVDRGLEEVGVVFEPVMNELGFVVLSNPCIVHVHL